jgi:uncharacterized protein (TIGR03067 family)
MQATLVAGLALALGAPALKDPPAREAPSLVGEWEVESMTVAGRPRAIGAEPIRYAFTADGKWYSYRGDRRDAAPARAYFTNPKAKPAAVDLNSNPGEQEASVMPGIYKVEGDTLTLCIRGRSTGRPTAFESSADVPTTLYVFRRLRAKDGGKP